MSFVGSGPLGRYGWGTTTAQALQQQADEVTRYYHDVQQAHSGSSTIPPPPMVDFPTLQAPRHPKDHQLLDLGSGADDQQPWLAAVYTANEEENLPLEQRKALVKRKLQGPTCLTGDHIVLTRSGWKPIGGVIAGADYVRSFNIHTYDTEWSLVTARNAHIRNPAEPADHLYRMYHTSIDVVATASHRMLVIRARAPTGAEKRTQDASIRFDSTPHRPGVDYQTMQALSTHNFAAGVQATSSNRLAPAAGFNQQRHYEFSIPGMELICDYWWQQDKQCNFLEYFGFWLGDGGLTNAHQNRWELRVKQSKSKKAVDYVRDLHDLVFNNWYRETWAWITDSQGQQVKEHTFTVRCPPLVKWLQPMLRGPRGYEPRDPQHVQNYPAFVPNMELMALEDQHHYANIGQGAHFWQEDAMLASMQAPTGQYPASVEAYDPANLYDHHPELFGTAPGLWWHPAMCPADEHPNPASYYELLGKYNAKIAAWKQYCHGVYQPAPGPVQPYIAHDQLQYQLLGKTRLVDGEWYYTKRWMNDAYMEQHFSNLSRRQAAALLIGFGKADGRWNSIKQQPHPGVDEDSDDDEGEDQRWRPIGTFTLWNSSLPLIQHLMMITTLAEGQSAVHRKKKANEVAGNAMTSTDHWTMTAQFERPVHLPHRGGNMKSPLDVNFDATLRGHQPTYQDNNRVYEITVQGNNNFLVCRQSLKMTTRGVPPAGGRQQTVYMLPVFVGNCHSDTATKREFANLQPDVIEVTNKFRSDALQSLQRRHELIEALPHKQRTVLHSYALYSTAVVVNVRLRELLCYPLIRDQVDGGEAFYTSALKHNEQLRQQLRAVRKTIYQEPGSQEWYKQVDDIHSSWSKQWTSELSKTVPDLSSYLQTAQLSKLEEISAEHDKKHLHTPDLQPSSSHDYNYGQQLLQMYHILTAHMLRTGNMQGIPRPRWNPDWACTDGYEALHPYVHGLEEEERAAALPVTGKGRRNPTGLHNEPSDLSTELPPPKYKMLNATDKPLKFGAGLTRLTQIQSALKPEELNAIEEHLKKQELETAKSVEQARLQHYGSVEEEQLELYKHRAENAAEKATNIKEYLTGDVHSTDLEGSYYWDEVQLAFRNHGTHWESLSEDITPLGEHYLLIHYDVQYTRDVSKWKLKVFGCVDNPVALSLDQIKSLADGVEYCMPMIMECSGNGRAMMKPRYAKHVPWGLQAYGCYMWTGCPLRLLLDRVGVTSDCVDIVFTGSDGGMEHEKEFRYFQHALEVDDPVVDHTWLIWANNGVDLLPEHGYPLRIITPAWYGNVNIKWLKSIEFIPRKFKGVYQRTYSYSQQPSDNDLAAPSQELRPRAMMKPIGYPDFTTRKRFALSGVHTFVGKTWVGGGHYRSIVRVDLSVDGGSTWFPCKLQPRLGVFAWAGFHLDLDLPVGLYRLAVRATDNLGQRQQVILEEWNWASMQDDAIQFLDLTVVDTLAVTE